MKAIDDALLTRDQVGDSVDEAKALLASVQAELREVPRTIGPTVGEAEEVLERYEVSCGIICHGVIIINQICLTISRIGQVLSLALLSDSVSPYS